MPQELPLAPMPRLDRCTLSRPIRNAIVWGLVLWIVVSHEGGPVRGVLATAGMILVGLLAMLAFAMLVDVYADFRQRRTRDRASS